MGKLIDGTWHDTWYDTEKTEGRFVRKARTFRGAVEADPGARFPAEPGRYRLYVSYACPWAHRTLILRALKGLDEAIGVTPVHPLMLEHGWSFDEDYPESLYGLKHLHQLYTRADPRHTGRVTVPVLWDTQSETIVNNESSEILRMLNTAFDAWGRADLDFYPEALRSEIDHWNDLVYETVNDGVYRSGFATRQHAYEQSVHALFETLDLLDAHLANRSTLVGEVVTEADIRLFTTLIRFDPVYHGHFKCNLRRIVDHPNLWRYTRAMYQLPRVAETVDLQQVKTHYYGSHPTINPTGIIPVGPVLDLDEPAPALALPTRG